MEFMLGVRASVRFRNGVNKWVLRQSLAGTLPEMVRLRDNNAKFGTLVQRGIRDRGDRILATLSRDSRVGAMGLVDPERVVEGWRRYRSSDLAVPPRTLLNALAVEAWLRSTGTSPINDQEELDHAP